MKKTLIFHYFSVRCQRGLHTVELQLRTCEFFACAKAANAGALGFGGDAVSDDWMSEGEPANLAPAARLHHSMGIGSVLDGISFFTALSHCESVIALRPLMPLQTLKLLKLVVGLLNPTSHHWSQIVREARQTLACCTAMSTSDFFLDTVSFLSSLCKPFNCPEQFPTFDACLGRRSTKR